MSDSSKEHYFLMLTTRKMQASLQHTSLFIMISTDLIHKPLCNFRTSPFSFHRNKSSSLTLLFIVNKITVSIPEKSVLLYAQGQYIAKMPLQIVVTLLLSKGTPSGYC